MIDSKQIAKIRTDLGLTQQQLADKLGVTKRTVQNWEGGATITKSAELLLHGLVNKNGPISVHSNDDGKGIPVYPGVFTTAGNAGIFRDLHDETPLFYIDAKEIEDCDYGIRVTGDSMYPLIKHGDYAACKTVLNMNVIMYGEKYHIVTPDYSTVKYIWPHPSKEDHFLLVPHNKSVPETPMPKSEIIRIGFVKAWVTL